METRQASLFYIMPAFVKFMIHLYGGLASVSCLTYSPCKHQRSRGDDFAEMGWNVSPSDKRAVQMTFCMVGLGTVSTPMFLFGPITIISASSLSSCSWKNSFIGKKPSVLGTAFTQKILSN